MKAFKNIIFDLGGVILNIDYKLTIEAFRKLDIVDSDDLYSKSSQIALFDELEKGNISESDFYSGIRKLSSKNPSDDQIKDAWNALLIGLPDENVRLLADLKKTHRLFLLSNTNCLHEKAYVKMVVDQYGYFIFEDLFEKMYLSHKLHLRKPDPAIFKYVIDDNNLILGETCFIDDSPQHVEGAKKAGIAAFHLKDQNLTTFFQIREYFSNTKETGGL